MVNAWLQVLSQGEQVAVMCTQVAHHLFHFIGFFTHPEHEPGLGRYPGVQGLEALQQGQ